MKHSMFVRLFLMKKEYNQINFNRLCQTLNIKNILSLIKPQYYLLIYKLYLSLHRFKTKAKFF